MKLLLTIPLILFSIKSFANCDNAVADSLTKKALVEMAKRYNSHEIGMGVSIDTGTTITTSVAIFKGNGGDDGKKVDRIGSITIDLEKCTLKNTLIGTFNILSVDEAL